MSDILGPKFGYVDLLDHGTKEASKKEEESIKTGEYRPKVLRPSSSGKCTRELAYGLMEQTGQAYYEKDIREPNVTRLLSVGHYIEDSFIDQFNKYTKDFFRRGYSQQSVMSSYDIKSKKYPDLLNGPIEGSLDDVFLSEDGKALIDYKSKKDKFHKHFKSDWEATTDKLLNMETVEQIEGSQQAFWVDNLKLFIEELADPFFEANFYQLNFYANSPWAKRKGIDHAAIIQYNKNDSRIREIRFRPSAELYEVTHQRFQGAVDAVDKGDPKLAKRDYKYSSIKCAFCPYSSECWKEKKTSALQAFFDTNFHKKKWPTELKKLDRDVAKDLETWYNLIKEAEGAEVDRKDAEANIIQFMLDSGIKKIKFRDGHVYERKYLKSGRPNWQLRRSKV